MQSYNYESPSTEMWKVKVESDVLTGSKVGVIGTQVYVNDFSDGGSASAGFGDYDLFNEPYGGGSSIDIAD